MTSSCADDPSATRIISVVQPCTARCFWWAPGVLFATLTAFYLFFIVDGTWHQGWDSATYLLTARNLAAGRGYTLFDQPFILRPPGFAYFLSWLIGANGPLHFYQLNILMALLGLAALVPIYAVFRRAIGGLPAAGATLLFATSPLFLSQFNLVLSEFLFLLLLYTGIWLLLPPAAGVRTSAIKRLAGLLVVTAAIYVRTIGLGLLPGIAVQIFRTKRLVGVAELLLVVALLLPWFQFTTHAAAKLPRPATQLATFDYKTGFFHVDPGDPTSPLLGPDDWVKRIISNTKQLMLELGRNVLHSARGTSAIIATLIVLGGFLAAWRGAGSLLDWWALVYTAILIGWFVSDPRFVLPLSPMFYYYAMVALTACAAWCEQRWNKRNIVTAATAGLIGVAVTINVATMRNSLDPYYESKEPGDYGQETWRMTEAAAQWIDTRTPKDAVILHRFPPIFELLSDRRVYGYLLLRGQPLPTVDYAVLQGPEAVFEPQMREKSVESWVLTAPESPSENVRIYRLR